MPKSVAVLVAAVSLFAQPAAAAENPLAAQPPPSPSASDSAPSAGLTEEEFLAPLRDLPAAGRPDVGVHPAVAALLADPAAARARLLSARLPQDPEIEWLQEGVDPDDRQTELVVGWQPPRPGRRRLDIAAARAGVVAATARFDLDLLELRFAWRTAFHRWALASARRRELAHHRRRLDELVARTWRRAEAGETSGLDARRLSLAAATVAAEEAAAAAEVAAARGEALAWRPDLPPSTDPVLRAGLDHGVCGPLAGAPPVPPAIAALEAEVRAARLAAEAAARILDLPRIATGWQRQEASGVEADRLLVGLSWSLPVFGQGRPQRLVADARADALEARLEVLRHRWSVEIEGARSACVELLTAAAAADAAGAQAAPAVAAAGAAFDAGELDLTGLLETLAAARATALAELDLRSSAWMAALRLERLGGGAVPPAVAPSSRPAFESDLEPGTRSGTASVPPTLPSTLGDSP